MTSSPLGLGDSGRFKDKSHFPTLTRFAYCQCRLRKVLGSVFRQFNWTDITIVIDRDDLHARVLGETLDVGLQKGGYLPNVIQYYGDENPDFGELLIEASERSRGERKHDHLARYTVQCTYAVCYTRVGCFMSKLV